MPIIPGLADIFAGNKPTCDGMSPSADLDRSQEAKLAAVQEDFPAFWIWRETILNRARYVSRSRDFRVNPHTVVTHDLDELRAALEPARGVTP